MSLKWGTPLAHLSRGGRRVWRRARYSHPGKDRNLADKGVTQNEADTAEDNNANKASDCTSHDRTDTLQA